MAALSPMRVVPASWMISPPGWMPNSCSRVGIVPSTLPPIWSMISRATRWAWRICSVSASDHFQWKRSTGMP